MIISIWRYVHLTLAYISFIFITISSITGAILAFRPIEQKLHPYKVEYFNDISLAETIPILYDKYDNLKELSIDKNKFVTLEVLNENCDNLKFYIDPRTGHKLGEFMEKSKFMDAVITLHRSLFLHETGHAIIGLMTLLLLLITISGVFLIIKRQQGFKQFFSKINKEYFSQYYHITLSRVFLFPILIITFTGICLCLNRFDIIPKPEKPVKNIISTVEENTKKKDLKDFKIFQKIKLADVRKIEFPSNKKNPKDFFIINLIGQNIVVNQINGKVEYQSSFTNSQILLRFFSKLHTGHVNTLWSIILGISCFSILFFIYSGFSITLKRTRTEIVKNKFKSSEAEIILFVGSENGTTLSFVNKIQKQLLANNEKSFVTQMNQYEIYPNAKQFIIFTSTYGIGNAPTNAKKFEQLIENLPQKQKIDFSVVGFGSHYYKQFCAYAYKVDKILGNQKWANRILKISTVNDESPEDFIIWVKSYKDITNIPLVTSPSIYLGETPKLKEMNVISLSKITIDDPTFCIKLSTEEKFKSGDLLVIYPANDYRERFYSIARINNKLHLIVKLHEFGLGSQYLHKLKEGDTIKARILKNKTFYFPTKAKKVIMIANGTGIAPFLGMIDENTKKIECHLYASFRHNNSITENYKTFIKRQIDKKHLAKFCIALSREKNKEYVTDLVKRDEYFFAETLQNNGIIMVCGSLAMQRDIEKILEQICQECTSKTFENFKTNRQFLTDCY